MDPITIAAILGTASSIGTNIWSAKRQDSAHQRQVRDLVRAGINPIHSAGGSGAPSQPLEDVSRGATSAVAVARARAELQLIQAQTNREDATAVLARTQAADVSSSAAGRYDLTAAQAEVAHGNARQTRLMLPMLLARAKEEVRTQKGTADVQAAEALLRQAQVTGAQNIEALERRLGELGPWMRLFLEALRSTR